MQTISATYRVTTPMFLGGVPSPEKEEAERLNSTVSGNDRDTNHLISCIYKD